jgi:hypothetical protein
MMLALCGCGRVDFMALDGGTSSDAETCATRTFLLPPMSSLTDDFSVSPLDSQWFVPSDAQCIAPSGGSLVATPPSLAAEYCLAYSGSFHLACDSLTVEVTQTTAPLLGVQTVLYVVTPDINTRMVILIEGGYLSWGLTTPDLGLYDSVAERWWRLSELDGTVMFETSPDGVTFTARAAAPDPIELDNVSITIGAGTYNTDIASPGVAQFRCLNLPAPCQ